MVYGPCEKPPFFGGLTGDDWDMGDGRPGVHLFGSALQVWAVMQDRDVTVGEAARVFNCPPAMIVEAVEEHFWMFLSGPHDVLEKRVIEHEGE